MEIGDRNTAASPGRAIAGEIYRRQLLAGMTRKLQASGRTSERGLVRAIQTHLGIAPTPTTLA